ncbi:TetR family transcriptional regulator [Nitrospirillum amazonense]|uniref:TetR family transcriptional regulator n=1 Tax=Nitrospirillum amazonense TaxID=28077 RepID=A0A560KI05_9PROT|nr:TetR/AcrR family transcriptional regulator [Nitrospirillum amazonense]TWB82911.1 TetR family transcriptional regulator [Nitrospirillum amazonense]
MKVKTEARRQAILDAAGALFQEVGFAAASMSELATRVGGSKATLYSYFRSKEELFVAVMAHAAAEMKQASFEALNPDDDVRETLTRLGRIYLRFVLSPWAMSIRRIAVSEAARSEVGRLLYENGPKVGWSKFAAYLTVLMDRGRLRRTDADRAAAHFRGLVEAEHVDLVMLDAKEKPGPAAIDTAADSAVDVFLRAYAAG